MVTDPETQLRLLGDEGLAALGSRGPQVSVLGVSSQLQAVANAFVMLGLCPERDVEAVLAEIKVRIDALGPRVSGGASGELTVRPGASNFWQARSQSRQDLADFPLRVAVPQLEIELGATTLTIESLVVTRSGLRGRGRAEQVLPGDGLSGLDGKFSELKVTDDRGRPYQLRGDGGAILTETASGRERWSGELVSEPAVHSERARGRQRWSGELVSEPAVPSDTSSLEITAPGSEHPTRVEFSPLPSVPAGTADPPWPTPAETYLAWLVPDGLGTDADASFGIGLTAREATAVVASVAVALLAVGALPPQSGLLRRPGVCGRLPWQNEVAMRWSRRAHRQMPAAGGPKADTSIGAVVPLKNAVAVVEYVFVVGDAVTLRLYVAPYVQGEYWPVSVPCVKVDATDETGTHYDTMAGSWRYGGEGRGDQLDLLVWPPVASDVRRLRIRVSTLWEAAWAEIELPGR